MSRGRTRQATDETRHPDGHVLLDGARWHYPKPGRPTECAVAGCERILGQSTLVDDDVDGGTGGS